VAIEQGGTMLPVERRHLRRRRTIMLGLSYALLSYLSFLASFCYLALFSLGLFVPKTVDSGDASGVGLALLINTGLMLIFGLQHSIMARARFKRWLTRLVPPSAERATYVLASSLALSLLLWQWRPMPQVLFSVTQPAWALALTVGSAIGWLGVPAASLLIDHFELVGLKQAFAAFQRRTLTSRGFLTPLLYKYVRHPMMSSLLLGLWLTPHFTLGHLVLALGLTLYVVIGVHYEERALVALFGTEYQSYQSSTPRFLPIRARQAAPAGTSPENQPFPRPLA
jgi:protein-S-isoprenylcysteine O-methyltransferase Ste14